MKLHHKRYGQGETLVILHGLFGSLENWHSVITQLANQFQVLAVDQRNHGHSSHSPEMDYRLMAEDVAGLLEEEGIARAHVMGHSMGGKTAMAFGLIYPELLRKLIIVDIAPRVYPPLHEPILEALMALNPSEFATRKQMEDALAEALPDLSLRRFLLKNIGHNTAGVFQWRFGLKEIARNYGHLRQPIAPVGHFEGPAMFVRGQHSEFLTEGDLAGIKRLFPQSVLETIPEAGHLVHVENPAAFVKMVTRFLIGPGI